LEQEEVVVKVDDCRRELGADLNVVQHALDRERVEGRRARSDESGVLVGRRRDRRPEELRVVVDMDRGRAAGAIRQSSQAAGLT